MSPTDAPTAGTGSTALAPEAPARIKRLGTLTAARWTRRRYVILTYGDRVHLVGRTRATGVETRCGKRGGDVTSWSLAREREVCASCLRGMTVP